MCFLVEEMFDAYPGHKSFPCGPAGKESVHNEVDLGSIPGLERSPGEGRGEPLQYSGLENSVDCIVHGVAKSRTQLSDFHFQDSHSEGLHENGEKKKGYLRSDFQAED